jgi:hypothetical protein
MSFHSDTLYGVYISQLIPYSRACGSYHDFLDRVLLKTRKLLNHGPWWLSLSHQSDLVKRYGLSVSPMTTDMLRLS